MSKIKKIITSQNLTDDDIQKLRTIELYYGGINVLKRRSVKRNDLVVMVNEDTNCTFGGRGETQLWVGSVYKYANTIRTSLNNTVPHLIEVFSEKYQNSPYFGFHLRLSEDEDSWHGGRTQLCIYSDKLVYYWRENLDVEKEKGFIILDSNNNPIKNINDLKYGTPYYIKNPYKDVYITVGNTNFITTKNKGEKEKFVLYPYIVHPQLSNQCLYVDWSKMVEKILINNADWCGESPPDIIEQCFKEIIDFCSTGDSQGKRLFDGYCKDTIDILENKVSSESRQKIDDVKISICEDYPDMPDCACIYPLSIFLKKKFKEGENDIQYPHCHVSECINNANAYRTKFQQMASQCAGVFCKISIDKLSEEAKRNVNIIQLCSQSIGGGREPSDSDNQENGKTPFFFIIIAIIFVILLIVLLSRGRNR